MEIPQIPAVAESGIEPRDGLGAGPGGFQKINKIQAFTLDTLY